MYTHVSKYKNDKIKLKKKKELGHDGLSNLLVGDNDNWNNAKAGTRT
jgi:hypothetical protein